MVDHEDDDERPEDSSAAQCIRFKMLKKEFGPKFVHQVFPHELIRGYLPPIEMGRPRGHPSFRGRHAKQYLCVSIMLSPSCQTAALRFDVSPVALGEQTCNKRRRLDRSAAAEEAEEEEEDIGSEDSETDEEDLESQDDGSIDDTELTQEELRAELVAFLPPLDKEANGSIQTQFLSKPIGTEINRYTANDLSFVMSMANEKECASYHMAVQKLSYWFIDAADEIDLREDSTDWKVLYLFQHHGVNKFSLCGYMTLFHFSSPFRKPAAGRIVRVCQALILPPYQRMGHGKTMLTAVFRYAMGEVANDNTTDPIVEVNCEDPAPGFQMLRSVVDYQRSVESSNKWFADIKVDSNNDDPSQFKGLKDADLHKAVLASYTTPTQVQTVYEISILQRINALGSDEVLRKQKRKHFEKLVRTRLKKTHAEELGTLEGVEATVRLDELLNEEMSRHETVLRHVH